MHDHVVAVPRLLQIELHVGQRQHQRAVLPTPRRCGSRRTSRDHAGVVVVVAAPDLELAGVDQHLAPAAQAGGPCAAPAGRPASRSAVASSHPERHRPGDGSVCARRNRRGQSPQACPVAPGPVAVPVGRPVVRAATAGQQPAVVRIGPCSDCHQCPGIGRALTGSIQAAAIASPGEAACGAAQAWPAATGMVVCRCGTSCSHCAAACRRAVAVQIPVRVTTAGTAARRAAAVEQRLRGIAQILRLQARRRGTAETDDAQGATDKPMDGTHGDQAP